MSSRMSTAAASRSSSGIALIGCAYALEGAIPLFWAALGGQVFWGIGYTFTSGATQAWITDEIGEEAAGPVFLRGAQIGLLGGLLGTLLSVVLGVSNIQLPMLLAGVGMLTLAGRSSWSCRSATCVPSRLPRAPDSDR